MEIVLLKIQGFQRKKITGASSSFFNPSRAPSHLTPKPLPLAPLLPLPSPNDEVPPLLRPPHAAAPPRPAPPQAPPPLRLLRLRHATRRPPRAPLERGAAVQGARGGVSISRRGGTEVAGRVGDVVVDPAARARAEVRGGVAGYPNAGAVQHPPPQGHRVRLG